MAQQFWLKPVKMHLFFERWVVRPDKNDGSIGNWSSRTKGDSYTDNHMKPLYYLSKYIKHKMLETTNISIDVYKTNPLQLLQNSV